MKNISRAVAVVPATLLLGGCQSSQPDYSPFGDGMKALGISLVVYGVVQSLTDLVMAEDKKPKEPPLKPSRPRRKKKTKGGE